MKPFWWRIGRSVGVQSREPTYAGTLCVRGALSSTSFIYGFFMVVCPVFSSNSKRTQVCCGESWHWKRTWKRVLFNLRVFLKVVWQNPSVNSYIQDKMKQNLRLKMAKKLLLLCIQASVWSAVVQLPGKVQVCQFSVS